MADFITWLTGKDLLESFIIIASGILAAIMVDLLLKFIDGATKFTKNNLDDHIINALRRPIFLGVTMGALFIAALKTDLFKKYHDIIGQAASIFAILIITYALTRLVKTIFQWKVRKGDFASMTRLNQKYFDVARKIINVIIYAVGFMIILNQLDIAITPLITSLGIGGLVIALALQETLSNFFAGFSVISERSIKIGDFIELDNEMKGFVEDMTWRVTKLRTLPNNIVLIPNSRLAQAIVTDYDAPQQEMSVRVEVGVSYDSDLDQVERITIGVAKKMQETIKGAVRKHEPFIRFHTFADSNINFSVILRGESFVDQYLLKHEFIKALKKAYDKHNITINYPVRTLMMGTAEKKPAKAERNMQKTPIIAVIKKKR